jgi:transcriptional regulator with PAS, ATPase and Fis domain
MEKRARGRDPRAGVAELVRAVAAALSDPSDLRAVRERFEQAMCRVIRLRAARLHIGQALATGTVPTVREGGGLDLPVCPGPAVLQAVPDGPRQFDAWDLQVLRAAADLATVILELDRSASGLPRHGAVSRLPPANGLVGSSTVMKALRELIALVAPSDAAVLVEGESGVGKELVARQIHEFSRRARMPFIAVNCAALVETLLEAELFGIEDRTATGVRGRRGKFELADGGTLFLDEVGDLSLQAQAKLLRVLQDMTVERVGGHTAQRVDVRVVAATNRPLRALVHEGRFRLDLYYRLNCVDIRVPPLRTRRGDVEELAEMYLSRHAEGRRLSMSPEAMEALLEYDWPGNVRELERVIQRAAILARSSSITLQDLPHSVSARYVGTFQAALDGSETLRVFVSRYVRLMLNRCGGNKREACRRLDISYHTLQAYLRLATKRALAESACDPPTQGSQDCREPAGALAERIVAKKEDQGATPRHDS